MYDFQIFYPEAYNVCRGSLTILEYLNILKPQFQVVVRGYNYSHI